MLSKNLRCLFGGDFLCTMECRGGFVKPPLCITAKSPLNSRNHSEIRKRTQEITTKQVSYVF